MTTHYVTAREFNQDLGKAKRATADGPVVITDRGQPSHVLLRWGDYERLVGQGPSLAEILGNPPGIEDVEIPEMTWSERPTMNPFADVPA